MKRLAVILSLLLTLGGLTGSTQAQSAICTPPVQNPVACENTQPGNPASEWDVSGAGDTSIQGYATDISVNKGGTLAFKVKTAATSYRLDIYRMGYYAGLGARKVASILPSAALPQNQPACLTDATTGLVDCGNWAVSATWNVPSTAVSGIYFARLVRTDTSGASHMFFVVRDDASNSPMLFQTSDTTWQAYNDYGGNSLYVGSPAGRAYKVSYNRPFNDRSGGTGPVQSWVFNAEYPMVRWLEANGYNLSYAAGVDTDRRGAAPLQTHKLFMSVGHDEYWSGQQRANVEAARAAGVHLAFFSGNEVFWKTRWENSIDTSSTPYRTLVSYKETHANQVIDPADPPTWTGTWRDARFSPPADGGRPENALTGTVFMVNGVEYDTLTVPASYSKLRFWRNTSVAKLTAGQTASLGAGCGCVLGYEWDSELDNGARPAGLMRLSSTTVTTNNLLLDNGSTFGTGSATHNLALYRAASGALVFGAGTVQWSWGLDGTHDNLTSTPEPAMQQATVNLFADMGIQPATLQPGLVAATASTDTVPPTSQITSPANGATVQVGTAVTISGTANDTGGVVAGVEVSTDGGSTWHPANGLTNWTYSWTPRFGGVVTLKSRAVDDSVNVEVPSAGISVTVAGDTTPPVISAVQATSVTDTGATIKWNTDEPSTSQVEYGPTTAYGSSTAVASALVINHAVQLSGLSANTLYHYRVKSSDFSNNLATSGDFTFLSGVPAGTTRATFDDLTPPDRGLNGQYPTGQIDWGTSKWYLSPAWGLLTTNSVSFASGSTTSTTFVFLSAQRLVSLQAYNGGTTSSTITLACGTNPTKTQAVSAGQLVTINTGWATACTTVTVGSSNSWNTNFDNFAYDSGGPVDTTPPVITGVSASNITGTGATITWTTDKLADSQVDYGTTTAYGSSTTLDPSLVTSHSVQLSGLALNTLYHYRVKSKSNAGVLATSGDFTFTTTNTSPPVTVTFDDLANPNRNLDGQYPTGQIDWGIGKWYLSSAWGLFTTNSISYASGATTSSTFDFVTPRRLVSLQAYNGGSGSSTITLSCGTNATKTQVVSAGQMVTIATGWATTCTTVTLASSNGWNTNFDNFVHDGG